MEQLTLQDIYNAIMKIKKLNIDLKDIQVYLGNDDELNGVHTAWNITPIDKNVKDNEDNDYLIELINEDYVNVELKGKGILIS